MSVLGKESPATSSEEETERSRMVKDGDKMTNLKWTARDLETPQQEQMQRAEAKRGHALLLGCMFVLGAISGALAMGIFAVIQTSMSLPGASRNEVETRPEPSSSFTLPTEAPSASPGSVHPEGEDLVTPGVPSTRGSAPDAEAVAASSVVSPLVDLTPAFSGGAAGERDLSPSFEWELSGAKLEKPCKIKGQPSDVFSDLLKCGVLDKGSPHFRFNENEYRWVAFEDWKYTATFSLTEKHDGLLRSPPSHSRDGERGHKRRRSSGLSESGEASEKKAEGGSQIEHPASGAVVILEFERLDHSASVSLNGAELGETSNAFLKHRFDVGGLLRGGGGEGDSTGVNTLEVILHSAPNRAKKQAEAYPYVVPFSGAPNGLPHVNFIRSPQSHFGWDWGPSFGPSSIGTGTGGGVRLWALGIGKVEYVVPEYEFEPQESKEEPLKVKVRVRVGLLIRSACELAASGGNRGSSSGLWVKVELEPPPEAGVHEQKIEKIIRLVYGCRCSAHAIDSPLLPLPPGGMRLEDRSAAYPPDEKRPGLDEVEVIAEMSVENPVLWWPRGLAGEGEMAKRYGVRASLVAEKGVGGGGAAVGAEEGLCGWAQVPLLWHSSAGGKGKGALLEGAGKEEEVDAMEKKIGIRKIRLVRDPVEDPTQSANRGGPLQSLVQYGAQIDSSVWPRCLHAIRTLLEVHSDVPSAFVEGKTLADESGGFCKAWKTVAQDRRPWDPQLQRQCEGPETPFCRRCLSDIPEGQTEKEGCAVCPASLSHCPSINLSERETFYVEVNGVPVFSRGANMIPFSNFVNVTEDQQDWIIDSANDAHMNMIRVWGGGDYQPDSFYDKCDEDGILVWQEFIFACAMYPTDEAFLSSVEEEVRQQTRRLSFHPSIVVWGGNNENEGALNWYQESQTIRELYVSDYMALYADTVERTFRKTAGGSPVFVDSSPSNGPLTEWPDRYRKRWGDSGSKEMGDMHFYDYNMDCMDEDSFPKARYVSEFGFHSLPAVRELQKGDPEDDLTHAEDLWMWSNFSQHRMRHQPEGIEQLVKLADRYFHFPSSQRKPSAETEEKFVEVDIGSLRNDQKTWRPQNATDEDYKAAAFLTQLAQGLCYDRGIRLWRRLRADPEIRTMGILYWQLNDIWQGPSWSSIEHSGRWRLVHSLVKRFFAPLALSFLKENGGSVEVHGVSDLPFDLEGGEVTARLRRFSDGAEVWKKTESHVRVPSLSSGPVLQVDLVKAFLPQGGSLLSEAECSPSDCFLDVEMEFNQRTGYLPSEKRGPSSLSELGSPPLQLSDVDPSLLKVREFFFLSPLKLSPLEKPNGLTTEVSEEKGGREISVTISLTDPDSDSDAEETETDSVSESDQTSVAPAFFVWLENDIAGRFSDNAFHLLPGESRTVSFLAVDSSPIDLESFKASLSVYSFFDSLDFVRRRMRGGGQTETPSPWALCDENCGLKGGKDNLPWLSTGRSGNSTHTASGGRGSAQLRLVPVPEAKQGGRKGRSLRDVVSLSGAAQVLKAGDEGRQVEIVFDREKACAGIGGGRQRGGGSGGGVVELSATLWGRAVPLDFVTLRLSHARLSGEDLAEKRVFVRAGETGEWVGEVGVSVKKSVLESVCAAVREGGSSGDSSERRTKEFARGKLYMGGSKSALVVDVVMVLQG
uniref:beta-mannosidase n=1 Tax=Chromera velia CCMP2878 TaxID=1169474 RepID=A0A0G4GYN0_9ALVE|eukprot:Cvel_5401.t1-p1 / transcript=Cvel_5401.t1 / gene=Cvel_5401 / organism=Chromera_velia_CCMP2878 / gene_product=Beta-mannosidase, putative / transcript_product=Beta-mannosidase, putative / location=Cvel_scaffold251:73417-83858(+) / protein_length=1647 / sequence_SO=supercontig / SO=protein_coding / is_pseudo=false